jgi:hypothetical protein
MSQQVKTQHTEVKRTRRGSRGGQGKNSTKYSMISAKASNIPVATESEDKKNLVLKWGNRNEYPYFLNYLAKNNPIHSGILRAKKKFTVSAGVSYEGQNQIAFDEFVKNKKSSQKEKNIVEILNDLSLDYEKSNMFVLCVRFSFVGDKKYRKTERIPFEKVRFELRKDEKGDFFLTDNICVSDNWLESNPTYEVIKPYNPNDDKQVKCFVLFKEESGASLDDPKARQLNKGVYPDPPYGGAITAIETGIQADIYDNSEIHNGFSLGTMIYLAGGQPKNEKDKKDLERDLGASSTGSLQAGRSMVIYGNGQDEKPTIEALNGNNLPDRYNNTKDGSNDSTIHGHEVVVPTLFGMKQEGSFNASELEIGYSIMQSNYFESRRADLENVLNFIMNDIAGIEGKLIINVPELVLPKEEAQPQFQVNNFAADQEKKKEQDVILERFKMLGTDKSKFNVLHSVSMHGSTEMSKDDLLNNARQSFAELTDTQAQALNLISQGEDFNSIRKALDISGPELARLYNRLATLELITKDGSLTDMGKAQNALNQVADIEIMYEYRLRPDAPKLVEGGTSREFCQTLISLNRLYTRDEINRISGVEGYDVFAYRGGWYHNPNSGKNEPGCRHEWSQVITFKN